MLTPEVLKYVESSVLCWLATASAGGVPNVSPKEIFCAIGNDLLVIANIASPKSARNVAENPSVCVAFVDVLVQKGFQVSGECQIVKKNEPGFADLAAPLIELAGDSFPFATLFKVTPISVEPIIAPRYVMYPETTEAEQIDAAKKTYGF